MTRDTPFGHFLEEHLDKFKVHLKEHGFTDRGVSVKVNDIRAFVNYLLNNDLTYYG